MQFRYDAYGRLKKLTNENNEYYAFGWDALDRLIAQRDLDSSGRLYHYNAVGDVSGVDHVPVAADSDEQEDDCPPLKHRFERDAVGRLIQKTTADGVTAYTYDSADNLLTITFTDLNGQQPPLAFNYMRNAKGKIVGLVDDAIQTGKVKGSRILDFVVVTSKTARKGAQTGKEEIIRETGGKYIRHPTTKELIELSDETSRIIRIN